MLLALNNKEIPNQWKHNELVKNKHLYTVAMIYAKNGHIPP